MAPAIRLAREGFVLDQGDVELLAEATDDFARDPASAAIFLNRGRPWRKGERLIQRDLGRTLQAIAAKGPAAFYGGAIAEKIVAAGKSQRGVLELGDFARYRAVERKPVECEYRGFLIISAPPPSSGGVVLCETLNVLEGYPLGELGFQSAQTVHFMSEALRRAFHDRNFNLGDPDFVSADVSRFLSEEYAAGLRAGIDAGKATPSMSLGGSGPGREGSNTTHFSVVDAEGNAVSLTYTLNDWFGARVTAAGTGILLNDEMDDFSAKPGAPNMYGLVEGINNAIAPGKRPLSSMTPTIVTRDGRLVVVIGTPGGSHIPTGVLQVLVNLIDHGMTLGDAVNAPRIHAQWLPDVIYHEKHALSADTMAILKAKGHELEQMNYSDQIAAILVGAPAIAGKPRGQDRLYGTIDPRLPVGAVSGE
jgi:gamma-glutamyltranspeptidase/glutathione hydrolase